MNIEKLIKIIKECGDIILKYRNSDKLEIEIKKDGSKVTNVDKQLNEILQNYLKDTYPTYGIMSEEIDKNVKDYTWYIDPLNGTGAYLKGFDSFNILVGLVRENIPILGLIYHPLYNKLYIGGESEIPRVRENEKETELKMPPHIKQNLLFTPNENWEKVFTQLFEGNPDYKLVNRDMLGSEFKDSRIHIVEGSLNLEINSNFGAWGTWDVCSGHAILSQLGGVMRDYYGNDIDYSKESLDNGFISADSIERVNQLDWIKGI